MTVCGKCLGTGLIWVQVTRRVNQETVVKPRFCGCASGVAEEIFQRTGQVPRKRRQR